MEITHGMYTFEQPDKVFVRKFKIYGNKYIKDYSHAIKIPEKFLEMLNYIATKELVFELDFSIAKDETIQVISVVHPKDQFCKKTAKKILTDRMNWAKRPFHIAKETNKKSWAFDSWEFK